MAKLLILSSDTGEGHNSAAAALELAASAAGLNVSIRKPLEESGKINRTMGQLYNTLLARRPQHVVRQALSALGADAGQFLETFDETGQ